MIVCLVPAFLINGSEPFVHLLVHLFISSTLDTSVEQAYYLLALLWINLCADLLWLKSHASLVLCVLLGGCFGIRLERLGEFLEYLNFFMIHPFLQLVIDMIKHYGGSVDVIFVYFCALTMHKVLKFCA